MTTKISMEWVPGVEVGPFKYDTLIHEYLDKYQLVQTEAEGTDATGWGAYEVASGEITIWTENNMIVSVRGEKLFKYKSKNLINMNTEELQKLFKKDPDEIGTSILFEDGTVLTPYEYLDWGLEIWLEEGVVVAASAYSIYDD